MLMDMLKWLIASFICIRLKLELFCFRFFMRSITARGPLCVRFAYHMFGSGIDYLKAYVGESVLWRMIGDQGDGWRYARFDIDSHEQVLQKP